MTTPTNLRSKITVYSQVGCKGAEEVNEKRSTFKCVFILIRSVSVYKNCLTDMNNTILMHTINRLVTLSCDSLLLKMRYFSAVTALALVAQSSAQDLVAALQADPDLSTLLSAISAVPGLADQLDAAEGITIFAPINSAFEVVDPASAAGQAIGNSDVDGIASVLSYHVVPQTIPSTAITATAQFVPTLLTPENVIGGASATQVTPAQNLGAQLNGTSVILRSGNLATSTVTQSVSKHVPEKTSLPIQAN